MGGGRRIGCGVGGGRGGGAGGWGVGGGWWLCCPTIHDN